MGSGSRGQLGRGGGSLLGEAGVPAWSPWGAWSARPSPPCNTAWPASAPSTGDPRRPHREAVGGQAGGGSVGQAGSCLRKQVCRAGLSRKCGASAMLIVITFNLLLKITQSQVKEDYRARRSLITGRRLRRRDGPPGYQPLPAPAPPTGAARRRGGSGSCVYTWVRVHVGPTGGLPHVCEGEDVLTCMLGHRLRPVHVDRCAFGRTRLRGTCTRGGPAPPSPGRPSRNVAPWDGHVVLGTRLSSPVHHPLPPELPPAGWPL